MDLLLLADYTVCMYVCMYLPLVLILLLLFVYTTGTEPPRAGSARPRSSAGVGHAVRKKRRLRHEGSAPAGERARTRLTWRLQCTLLEREYVCMS